MLFFFFNDTATTEIYTLSLHDALPILGLAGPRGTDREGDVVLEDVLDVVPLPGRAAAELQPEHPRARQDRKSTRLNSSHSQISYAVFCLKKTKNSDINSTDRRITAPPV